MEILSVLVSAHSLFLSYCGCATWSFKHKLCTLCIHFGDARNRQATLSTIQTHSIAFPIVLFFFLTGSSALLWPWGPEQERQLQRNIHYHSGSGFCLLHKSKTFSIAIHCTQSGWGRWYFQTNLKQHCSLIYGTGGTQTSSGPRAAGGKLKYFFCCASHGTKKFISQSQKIVACEILLVAVYSPVTCFC